MSTIEFQTTSTASHSIGEARNAGPKRGSSVTSRRARAALLSVSATTLMLVPALCCAHSRLLHKRISEKASLSSGGLQSFLTDYLGSQAAPFTDFPSLSLDNFPGTAANNSVAPISW